MKLLLDSHVWVRLRMEPERLSPRARRLVEASANELFLSAATAWEISIKYHIGKLSLPSPPARWLAKVLDEEQATPLPISHDHGVRAGELPQIHADPFDRVLVAQAQLEELTFVTADERLSAYDVKIIPAL